MRRYRQEPTHPAISRNDPSLCKPRSVLALNMNRSSKPGSSHGRVAAKKILAPQTRSSVSTSLKRDVEETRVRATSATRPAFLRVSPRNRYTSKNIALTGNSFRKELNRSETFEPRNVQPLPWDDSPEQDKPRHSGSPCVFVAGGERAIVLCALPKLNGHGVVGTESSHCRGCTCWLKYF